MRWPHSGTKAPLAMLPHQASGSTRLSSTLSPAAFWIRRKSTQGKWQDQPGDPRGKRTGHGTGASHLFLLERKHKVEDAIYGISGAGGA